MKKTVIRIFALLLAAVMVLSLGVTAFAAELDLAEGRKGLDITDGNFNGHEFAESLNKSVSSDGDLGVFTLELASGGEEIYLSAFLLEKDGNVYLVTGGGFAEVLNQCSLTLISSGAGGYAQKATVLGEDSYFTYLSASGLDQFIPFSHSTQESGKVTLYVELMGERVDSGDIDLTQTPCYSLNNSDDVVFVDAESEPDYMFIGVPMTAYGTLDAVAMGTVGTDPESGNACLWVHTINYAEPNAGYAIGTMNGGNSGNNGGSNDGGETGSGFEFKPIYLLAIAAVAVVIFLIVRANTRSSGEVAKPGTVALEPTNVAPAAGETQPLDPFQGNHGTLPLNPNYDPVPVAPAWQLKAVGGNFNGQTFPITGTLKLGRAPQCQIVFPAGTPGISSNHCEVAVEGGSVVLRDLGSSYGTFCKGSKLAPNAPCYLNAGDTFTMAQGQTFQLEAAGAAAPVQSVAPIVVKDAQGREYRTGSGRMAFGRAAGNKVQFPGEDKSVSSNHCVLYREGGKLYLMDVGSTNGTFINEKERLQPNVPYRIRKGMVFFLTNRKNTFVIVED